MSTIRYSVSGLREGPALLLLHAMGANRHMWDECATLWSPQFAVVACDLRGAGESPPPDRPRTPEDHANDFEAVRAELGLDQMIPVGCAIGAVVATWYAHRHPRHVRALVLSEPTSSIDESARGFSDFDFTALIKRGGPGSRCV